MYTMQIYKRQFNSDGIIVHIFSLFYVLAYAFDYQMYQLASALLMDTPISILLLLLLSLR